MRVEYVVHGRPVEQPSGVNRGSEDGKTDYLLVRDGPMYQRWADLLTRAIAVRGRRNWMNADSQEDLERFKRSAARHFEQLLAGVNDGEDHAAAVFFNINGWQHVEGLLRGERP